MNYPVLPVNLNMSDEEVREVAKRSKNNGYYCVFICKKCGNFETHPEADTNTCEIKTVCKECFDS